MDKHREEGETGTKTGNRRRKVKRGIKEEKQKGRIGMAQICKYTFPLSDAKTETVVLRKL